MFSQSFHSQPKGIHRDFRTTHWSVVLLAGQEQSPASTRALEELCCTYWYPLYAFVRRKGHDAHEAQDLIQGYFHRLLERNYLEEADRTRGRFRTFLLTTLSHYMADEWRRSHAQKRGGCSETVPLDGQVAEERYRLDAADHLTAHKIFERRWADTVLKLALQRLQTAYETERKGAHFAELKTYLVDDKGAVSYAETAQRLGLSLPAVKSAIRKLRRRYGEAIRTEILETVGDAGEVEDEIRHLFEALSG